MFNFEKNSADLPISFFLSNVGHGHWNLWNVYSFLIGFYKWKKFTKRAIFYKKVPLLRRIFLTFQLSFISKKILSDRPISFSRSNVDLGHSNLLNVNSFLFVLTSERN